MAPQISPTVPSPAPQAPAPADALERLRTLVGPNPTTDELFETVRRELRREYERGYLEGRGGKSRTPAPKRQETDYQRFKRRLERRSREWMANTRQLRKAILNLVLVIVLSAAGIAVSMRVSAAGGDKKFAIPGTSR